MRRPNFFIVGAPKCGTTAMNYYLGQHPEVFMPEMKEIHYFGSDLRVKREMSLASYLSIFDEATDEKKVGETSVWYLYSEFAAREIKDFDPEAQIIIMLRNPVDKLYSDYSYALYRGGEDIPDLEAALEAEEERKKTIGDGRKPVYRESLGFTEQIQRYVDVFGWERIHVIIYDDLQNDVSGTYRNTLEFLDVRPDFEPELRVVNANKQARSKALQRFLRRPPQGAKSLVRSVLPRALRNKIHENLKQLNSRYETRAPMDPALRERLQKELAPEVERLSEFLGRDLTHWSR